MDSCRKVITSMLIILILVWAFSIQSMARAQTITYYSGRSYVGNNDFAFTLAMYSPTNQTNYAKTLPLSFNINWTAIPQLLPVNNWTFSIYYYYSIDNGVPVHIAPNNSSTAAPSPSYWFSTSVGIANLTNGYHEIAILTGVQFGPNILFNQSTVPVTFSVQNSTLNPSVPELSALVVLPLSLFLLFVAVALMHRKDVNIKK